MTSPNIKRDLFLRNFRFRQVLAEIDLEALVQFETTREAQVSLGEYGIENNSEILSALEDLYNFAGFSTRIYQEGAGAPILALTVPGQQVRLIFMINFVCLSP